MQKTNRIRQILHEIQAEMTQRGLWEAAPPRPEALASTQPFCYDTLHFEQWLQWIFIPRLHALLDHSGDLPFRSQITPLAEMRFDQLPEICTDRLCELLQEFDELAGGND